MLRDIPPPRYALQSERLIAEPVSTDAVTEVYDAAMESFAELYPFMSWCHAGMTETEVREWAEVSRNQWETMLSFEYVIRAIDDRRLLGFCGLNQICPVNRYANLGYWTRSNEAGRGVASEAVQLLTEFGFGTLELHRIEIIVAVTNLGSSRVAEKAGAQHEGILRNRLLLHGHAVDAHSYSLVPEA